MFQASELEMGLNKNNFNHKSNGMNERVIYNATLDYGNSG